MGIKTDWIKNKLIENDMDNSKVYMLYDEYCETFDSISTKETFCRYVRHISQSMSGLAMNESTEVLFELENGKLRDTNNALRRINRNTFRAYSDVNENVKSLVKALSLIKSPKPYVPKHDFKNKETKIGIIQLSDLHMNTLVSKNMNNGNEYNFDIANKRCRKYADECIKLFKSQNVTNVVILMTGDFISSNRRRDEKLAQSTSLGIASVICTYILEQFIIDVAKYFNVEVRGCVGNESRVEESLEMGNNPLSVTDNYDYNIMSMLKMIFRNTEVKIQLPHNPIEEFVQIKNNDKYFNLLLVHGNFLPKISESCCDELKAKYVHHNIDLNLIAFGHIHHPIHYQGISACGCMIGNNDYSSSRGFSTNATQTCYIVDKNNSYWAIDIDLNDVSGIEGYNIDDDISCYGEFVHEFSKSASSINIILK